MAEGEVWRMVRMAPELMETMCTRDDRGNRLRVEWGVPGADGFYCPIIHVDYTDNPFSAIVEVLARQSEDGRVYWWQPYNDEQLSPAEADAFNGAIALLTGENPPDGWDAWAKQYPDVG